MRIEQLTFTRFIAAISIVIFHYGNFSSLFNNEYVSFIFKQANIGVSYFFILSGFVMIVAYGNKKTINALEYIKNRFARVYPVYLFAIVLIIASRTKITAVDLLLNITLLQSWFPGKALTVNFVGWSLSVEMFFYVIFPLLFNKIYSRKSLPFNTLWIILFWLISQLILHLLINGFLDIKFLADPYFHPIMHLNEFLIGNLAGLYFLQRFQFYKKNYFVFIFILLVIFILLLKFQTGLIYHNGVLAIIFVPLILFLSLSTDKFTKVFCRREFIFLGEISFGIYIYQAVVWIFISDYRIKKYFNIDKIDYTSSFFVRLSFLILISAVSYLFLEKPLRKLLSKKSELQST